MHSLLLVTGKNISLQMDAFSDHKKVAPRKIRIDSNDIKDISKAYRIDPLDLDAILEKVPEWTGGKGGRDDAGLFWLSTENPDAKFEWYEKGGRFKSFLKLKEPRKPSVFGKLLGQKPKTSANSALKIEICLTTFEEEKPAVFLHEGNWNECPINATKAQAQNWDVNFLEFFNDLEENTKITVIDIHT